MQGAFGDRGSNTLCVDDNDGITLSISVSRYCFDCKYLGIAFATLLDTAVGVTSSYKII